MTIIWVTEHYNKWQRESSLGECINACKCTHSDTYKMHVYLCATHTDAVYGEKGMHVMEGVLTF